MRRLLMIAGAAAMAVSMPALAEKGGKGNGGGHGAHAGKPEGGGHAARGGGGGGHHGGSFKPHKAERQALRGGGGGGGRGDGDGARLARTGKPDKAWKRADRQARRGGGWAEPRLARDDVRASRQRSDLRFRDDGLRFASGGDGCPPGLAKKGNGCLPPGQAKKLFHVGQHVERTWFGGYNVPASYQTFYADTPETYYRYDDGGYIYRVDRGSNLISGLVPLLGGGFAVGQPLPTGYDVYNVPLQYRDVWADTSDANYRYGDNAIYQVDPQTGIIESIVALLAGDLNVGEALPTGYDAYNVPLDYRDEYADSDDTLYRYADGNIYQVDAKTQMIQAIVEMLV